jgi:hypothetical protein
MSAPDASSPELTPKPVTSDDAPRRSGGSSIRLVVLLLILLVAGVAAGWDYLVARPGYEQALEKVEPLLPVSDRGADDGQNPAPAAQKTATQEDVHAALNLAPAVTETAGSYLVERYSWRRGLPWLTYDLWIIYDDDAGRTLRNATSMRAEADLYYATARQPDAPASEPAGVNDSPSDASEQPAGEPSESPADAEADAAEAPADETPEPTAGDAPADDS